MYPGIFTELIEAYTEIEKAIPQDADDRTIVAHRVVHENHFIRHMTEAYEISELLDALHQIKRLTGFEMPESHIGSYDKTANYYCTSSRILKRLIRVLSAAFDEEDCELGIDDITVEQARSIAYSVIANTYGVCDQNAATFSVIEESTLRYWTNDGYKKIHTILFEDIENLIRYSITLNAKDGAVLGDYAESLAHEALPSI